MYFDFASGTKRFWVKWPIVIQSWGFISSKAYEGSPIVHPPRISIVIRIPVWIEDISWMITTPEEIDW